MMAKFKRSCVNNPSEQVNLSWLTIPQYLYTEKTELQQKSACLAKHFTQTNRVHTGMSVVPVTFHVCWHTSIDFGFLF